MHNFKEMMIEWCLICFFLCMIHFMHIDLFQFGSEVHDILLNLFYVMYWLLLGLYYITSIKEFAREYRKTYPENGKTVKLILVMLVSLLLLVVAIQIPEKRSDETEALNFFTFSFVFTQIAFSEMLHFRKLSNLTKFHQGKR